jgi:hypothetical protein
MNLISSNKTLDLFGVIWTFFAKDDNTSNGASSLPCTSLTLLRCEGLVYPPPIVRFPQRWKEVYKKLTTIMPLTIFDMDMFTSF